MSPFFLPAIAGIAFILLGPLQVRLLAALPDSITITAVSETEDQVAFDFSSTFPRGTSYQAQFLRRIENAWADIPDAVVEEIDSQAGLFRVSAPSFGGNAGFYRVMNSVFQPGDPVQDTLAEADPEEILLLWNQPGGRASTSVSGKLFYHVPAVQGGPTNNLFEPYPAFDFGPGLPVGESGAHDVLAADLNGDGTVDPLFAWANPAGQITLHFARIVQTNFTWESASDLVLTNFTVHPAGVAPTIIRILPARVSASGSPRIFLACTGADGFVHIALLEFDSELATVRMVARINDASLPFENQGNIRDRSAVFDIAAGDFDGDGIDEVALLATEAYTVPNGILNWRLLVRFYDYNPATSQFTPDTIPAAEKILYAHDNRATRWLSRVAAHAADFDGDGRDELAAAYHVGYNDQASPWFLQILKPAANLASLAKSPAQGEQLDQTTGSNGYPLSMLTGEFDGDPEPELVYGARQLFLYNVRTNLTFNRLATGGLNTQSDSADRRFMALANLDSRDPNIGFRPEIVVATDNLINNNTQRRFTIKSLRVTGDTNTFLRIDDDAVLNDEVSNNATRHFALAAADFGGNGLKLGTPRRFTRTVTGRPLVIVNAPPVHFDVLGGTAYDINDLFPVSDCPRDPDSGQLVCPFFSRYAAGSTESITVETQWKRGWDVSITAEAGFKLPIKNIGVEAEVTVAFGEVFDTYTAATETTTIDIQVDAIAEDRIYAATVTYNVWEYPVLANGETVGHILVIDPDVTRQNWFGSKSIIAQNYRPYHEVGNLLSYRAATEPYAGADYVREIVVNDTFTVDATSGYVWRLTRVNNQTTTDSKTFNFSINSSASFQIPIPWIPNIKAKGGYDSSKLQSATTTLEDQQGLTAFLGSLAGNVAGTAYSITPYLYWDNSGAVVLDYAVDLPTGTAGVSTFWRQHYSTKSDPTFILPWRLDPEKGQALPDPSQRQLTRDIVTIPPEPRPGEAVNLVARLSNFSFLDTPTTFRLRFYLGDPAAGGQLITSTNGRDSILVPAGVPGRGKFLAQFPWRIPETASSASLQIYAVIDPDNQLEEIHEDNNVGWNEIFLRLMP